MHEHWQEGDLVTTQGKGGYRLQGIEDLIEGDIDNQRQGDGTDCVVIARGRDQGIAYQPDQTAEQRGQSGGQQHPGDGRLARTRPVPRADSMPDLRQRGQRQ